MINLTINFFISFLIALVFILFSKQIMGLYGNDYLAGLSVRGLGGDRIQFGHGNTHAIANTFRLKRRNPYQWRAKQRKGEAIESS